MSAQKAPRIGDNPFGLPQAPFQVLTLATSTDHEAVSVAKGLLRHARIATSLGKIVLPVSLFQEIQSNGGF
ncbi:MAG: hypothetical protein KBD65_00845 [Candidatus Moranbacteria bacterium]|nr:hypothetical protein [Candidatus Moranbacteria bacterium]